MDSINIDEKDFKRIKCMFGFNSGAVRIDFGRAELILTCLVSQK
jgi:hypothetical protein